MWLCEGLLGSGARSRSDFAGLSWNNVRDGYLVWTPKKTDESTGAMVRIKIADKHLKAALATRSKDDGYFLQSREGGGPWSDSHIGKMFRQWCREAGLSDRVVMHGLRKLFATRMADAGASVLQIAAALGDTPESAMGYIKKRNTSKLSDDAIDLIAEVEDVEAA
jgi:integrase